MYVIRAINPKGITLEQYNELAFSEKSIMIKVKTFREVCEYLGEKPQKVGYGYGCSKGGYDYIITKE